jgi:hypothetical protein
MYALVFFSISKVIFYWNSTNSAKTQSDKKSAKYSFFTESPWAPVRILNGLFHKISDSKFFLCL